MFQQFNKWIAPNEKESAAENKLREICLEYSETEIITATQNLNEARQLGKGNYGAVYKGTFRDGHEVAIKVLEVGNDDSSSGFAEEVMVLSKFRHPNLVTLMGWGSAPGRRFLVYELLEGGDVSVRLQQCQAQDGTPFGWAERLRVGLDAACGLSHMHNSTPKAFHRDIKSANILLDRSGIAKMADFGLSGIAQKKGKTTMTCEQISGTPGYACPHYIKSGRVTEETEVYAYGMVLLELLLNSRPACLGQNGAIVYPIYQVVVPQAAGALERTMTALDIKASWPPLLAREISDLALRCSNIEEGKRPQFADIARHLRQLRDIKCSNRHVGQGGANPTQPKMGFPHPAASPRAGEQIRAQSGFGYVPSQHEDLRTRPQMGPDANPVTQPKLGNGTSLVTQPGGVHSPRAEACIRPPLGFADCRTRPQLHHSPSSRLPSKMPAELAEVVLECTHSSGVDVAKLFSKHRCLVLKAGEGPWTVGRMQQPDLFARLVPDETLRTVISRNHLVLSWMAPTLQLKKLSPNVLLVDGAPAPAFEIAVTHGSKIEFCGKDQATSFLTFTIVLRDSIAVSLSGPTPLPTRPDVPATAPGQLPQQQLLHQQRHRQSPDVLQTGMRPHSQQIIGAQQPPSWSFIGPPAPYSLVCVLAHGYDVMAKPPSMRTIGIPSDSRITVGRSHQPGFFEGILGAESAQHYLCCVSRSHFEVARAVGVAEGAFEVTNCSSNPVVLAGHRRLGKGDTGKITTGDSIDFLGANIPGANGPTVFLTLRVEKCRGSNIQVEPEPEHSSASKYRVSRTRTTSFSQGQLSCAAGNSTSTVARPPASDQMVSYRPPEKQSHALLPTPQEAMQHSHGNEEAPHFWLTLCGSAVKECYPVDARRLGGGEDGLSVGRAHQKELHLEAFDVELRQYLSRDHFRIDPGIDGSYKLVAISNNPIWRNRAGKRTEAVVGDPPLTLIHGDAVQLFTGADDCTATGPGNRGSLLWIFQNAKSNKGTTEEDVSILESRSAGHSQGFHDSDSGPRTMALGLDQDKHNAKPVVKTSQSGQHVMERQGWAESPRSKEHGGSVLRPPVGDMSPGPLRAPVRGLSLDDDGDNDHQHRDREMDFEFREDVDDAFTASGFRF